MNLGTVGVIGALALGAAIGAIVPVPAHEGHEHAEARPELSLPPSADYDYDPPEPGSYRLPALKAAADGEILDETGAAWSLRDLLEGKLTVVSFIYTRCADVCPLATLLLQDIHEVTIEDAALRESMQLVTISFDPEHDTPEVMAMHADAVRNVGAPAAPWRFLTTASTEALKPLLAGYDQPVGRKLDADDPLGPYGHQLRVFLIDRDAEIRNIYTLGFLDPRLVVTDVRTLLMEERQERTARLARP